MPAPSNPELKHPPCPDCGYPVTLTVFSEALKVVNDAGDTLTVMSAAPDDYRITAGVPEKDELALFPCAHILLGRDAHDYQRAALQLTFPHVRIDMRLVIPAGASGHDQPAILEVTSEETVDDLLGHYESLPVAVRRELRRMSDQLVAAVPRPTPGGPL